MYTCSYREAHGAAIWRSGRATLTGGPRAGPNRDREKHIMTTKTPKPRPMFAIDAPAHVENLARFFKCCGGLGQIEQTFRAESERLQFRFRADDPNSVPLFSERRATTDLVVRVRVRKRYSTGAAASATDRDYHWEPFGMVDTLFHFDHNICDMQLLPTAGDIRNELIKSDFILNCGPDHTLYDDHSHTLIKQYFYTRYTQPKSVFAMMQKAEASELQADLIRRVRKSRKVQAVMLRWDAERVPNHMPDERERLDQYQSWPGFDQLRAKMAAKFQEQPIWSRKALLAHLQCPALTLRFFLPLMGYFFENGPFRNLCIRYGYDPRKDPGSKNMQVIDIRFSDISSSQFHKSSMFKDPKFRTGVQSESTSATVVDHQSYRFGPNNPASLRSTTFQLCYVDSDQVQQIVHENDGQETECTERDGWLAKGATERIRAAMHEIVKPMMSAVEVADAGSSAAPSTSYPGDAEFEEIEVSEVFHPDLMDEDTIGSMGSI